MKLCITIACFLIALMLNAQEFICGNDNQLVPLKSTNCTNWDIYSPVNPNDTPIKTIRITFHVIQKNDGTGNFPDNATSRNWLQSLVVSINGKFGNLEEMNLPTSSPHVTDSRIQFSLANIYFWQDDYGWSFQLSDSFGDYLHNKFVTNQPNVAFKNNSIHIFMSEDDIGHGQASDFGDKSWIITSGTYASYLNNNSWDPTNNISHELGHNCGLYHTWLGSDGCNDTPNNPNCWNINEPNNGQCTIPSNNLMDYNACKCALTICQVNRMHFYLLGGAGNISDCVVNSVSIQNPTIVGNDLVCSSGASYSLANLQLGVTSTWNTSPISFFQNNSGCGNSASILPISSSTGGPGQIIFSFDWQKYGSSSTSKNFGLEKSVNLSYVILIEKLIKQIIFFRQEFHVNLQVRL